MYDHEVPLLASVTCGNPSLLPGASPNAQHSRLFGREFFRGCAFYATAEKYGANLLQLSNSKLHGSSRHKPGSQRNPNFPEWTDCLCVYPVRKFASL